MAPAKRKQLLSAVLVLLLRRFRRRSKRWENRETWAKTWILRRSTHGVYNNLIAELSLEDRGMFKSYMRMTPDCFNQILAIVAPHIEKENTKMRPAVSPGQRLAITLRFLATGKNVFS